MKTLTRILLIITLAVALFKTSNSVQAESQMIDLGTLGGDFSLATDINNNNQIVGISYLAGGRGRNRHAFLWENGTMTDLTPGYPSYAAAINQNGQIAGSSFRSGEQRAALWDHGQEIELYGSQSIAYDINEIGQVVGAFTYTIDISSYPRAFLWENGTVFELGTLGGNASTATSINNRGEIVGWSTNAEGISRPFLWKDGVLTDLGTLGGEFGGATSINSSGRVVGATANELGQSRPTLWFQNRVTDLDYPFQGISPEYISNAGNIAGYFSTGLGSIHGFVSLNGSFIDLGTLGGSLSIAWSVNDDGHVVGHSSNAYGQEHAFLWMP